MTSRAKLAAGKMDSCFRRNDTRGFVVVRVGEVIARAVGV